MPRLLNVTNMPSRTIIHPLVAPRISAVERIITYSTSIYRHSEKKCRREAKPTTTQDVAEHLLEAGRFEDKDQIAQEEAGEEEENVEGEAGVQ